MVNIIVMRQLIKLKNNDFSLEKMKWHRPESQEVYTKEDVVEELANCGVEITQENEDFFETLTEE